MIRKSLQVPTRNSFTASLHREVTAGNRKGTDSDGGRMNGSKKATHARLYHYVLPPQTSTLSPQSSAPCPDLSTLNSQPSALSPQPSVVNPHSSILKAQPSTLNPQPSTLNPQPSTLSPQSSSLIVHNTTGHVRSRIFSEERDKIADFWRTSWAIIV